MYVYYMSIINQLSRVAPILCRLVAISLHVKNLCKSLSPCFWWLTWRKISSLLKTFRKWRKTCPAGVTVSLLLSDRVSDWIVLCVFPLWPPEMMMWTLPPSLHRPHLSCIEDDQTPTRWPWNGTIGAGFIRKIEIARNSIVKKSAMNTLENKKSKFSRWTK